MYEKSNNENLENLVKWVKNYLFNKNNIYLYLQILFILNGCNQLILFYINIY